LTTEEADGFFECSGAPLVEVDGTCRGRVRLDDVTQLHRWYAVPHKVPAPTGRAARREEAQAPPGSAEAVLESLVGAAASRRQSWPSIRLIAHAGTCGRAVGADSLADALRRALESLPLEAQLIEGACPGMCHAAPSVEVQKEGWPRFLIERLDLMAVPALLDRLATDRLGFAGAGLSGVVWADRPWRDLTPAGQHPFWKRQTRVLLARCGSVDPVDLDDALLHGAYRALAPALDRPADEVIETVKASGLQGRGGAFFPTGLKWEACRRAAGDPKYVVVNGEEGEPGIFKDRHLMEGDPHQVLEGALLAAYAAGATHVILYVHGEAHLSAERLLRAMSDAAAAGLIGDGILGRDFSCSVE